MENIGKYINSIDEGVINTLARSYDVLAYSHNLKTILSSLFPEKDFSNFTKYQLHEIINDIITNYFRGESRLKAKLVDIFVGKNVTASFEIKVNTSRVDFLTLNGDTQSYEIKSGIDNLSKLAKQVSDYEKVFEFNYIVIDEKHLESALHLISDHYGIYVMGKEKLVKKKSAGRNCCLEGGMQLRLFTKKELIRHFKGINPDPEVIIQNYSDNEINEIFKIMLKKRYEKRWMFLKENKDEIFPIDYQFFFHHNITPKVIYGV